MLSFPCLHSAPDYCINMICIMLTYVHCSFMCIMLIYVHFISYYIAFSYRLVQP
ncbi:hypothetical protein BACPEC_02133 [[Bacteroides] pectinophilus ATCC 43243]|uniref:Uncharacterized protein n=1 Tax=[Bacteroides] pectinophilus ATCC 43243 TaxID=483218 RepID=B7ASS6_9FIRM|nr:hypothetical protein BACPEC_02133 [[Bacteroides] pectinophilus ATCC 43243]